MAKQTRNDKGQAGRWKEDQEAKAEHAEGDVEKDVALGEFYEWLTGETLGPGGFGAAERARFQRTPITTRVLQAAAWEAVATLLYKTRRGSIRASETLLRTMLLVPGEAYDRKVERYDMEGLRAEAMVQARAAGMTRLQAEAYVRRMLEPAVEGEVGEVEGEGEEE